MSSVLSLQQLGQNVAKVADGTPTYYTWDERGRLTEKTTGEATTYFTWRENDLLESVVNASTAAYYHYDSQRRRIAKVVDGTPTYFVYDLDWNAIAEYDASMSLQAADVTVGVDDHVARIEDSAAYYLYDDALETVAGMTDGAGDRVAYYEYDAWGNEWSWSSGSIANAFLYTGALYDEESGLLCLRNRYLDPASGRFISKDPARGGGPGQVYVYVGARPTVGNDPTGLQPVPTRPGCFDVAIQPDPNAKYGIVANVDYYLTRHEKQCCSVAVFVQISDYVSRNTAKEEWDVDPWHIDPWRSTIDPVPDRKKANPHLCEPFYPYQTFYMALPLMGGVVLKGGGQAVSDPRGPSMTDRPGWSGAGRLIWAQWYFETCVVCTSGSADLEMGILGCTKWHVHIFSSKGHGMGALLPDPHIAKGGEGINIPRREPSETFLELTKEYGFRTL